MVGGTFPCSIAIKVAATLAEALLSVPNVQTTYSRGQLTGDISGLDDVGKMVRRSFHPDRSGDVYAVAKPYFLIEAKSLLQYVTWLTPSAHREHVVAAARRAVEKVSGRYLEMLAEVPSGDTISRSKDWRFLAEGVAWFRGDGGSNGG